jgi:hypothetical protein
MTRNYYCVFVSYPVRDRFFGGGGGNGNLRFLLLFV